MNMKNRYRHQKGKEKEYTVPDDYDFTVPDWDGDDETCKKK